MYYLVTIPESKPNAIKYIIAKENGKYTYRYLLGANGKWVRDHLYGVQHNKWYTWTYTPLTKKELFLILL